MKKITILYLCMIAAISYNEQSYEQFIKSTPQKFGLLTVTHARSGDYQYFQDYINRYAEMQCELMFEISVVWNNQISPEEAGFSRSEKWKRPVYFVKTPYNSMDFRYMLPKESQAQVFFSIDDDIQIDCEELMKSFKVWQEHSVGDIGPIVSYGPRGYDFFSKKSQFKYQDPENAKFFSLMLIGIAWVPRLYLDLYNTDRSWQIHQMREVVREKNNCDDIALNFIVNFFFPEFISVAITGKIKLKSPSESQGFTKTHYSYRSECLGRFTEILGYNPLRLVYSKNVHKSGEQEEEVEEEGENKAVVNREHDKYSSQIQNQTIFFKRKLLINKYLTDSSGKQLSTQYFLQVFETAKSEHPEKVYNPEILTTTKNDNTPRSQQKSTVSVSTNNDDCSEIESLKQEIQRMKAVMSSYEILETDEMRRMAQLKQIFANTTKISSHEGEGEGLDRFIEAVYAIVMGISGVGMLGLIFFLR